MIYLWATLLVLLNAVWLALVVIGLPGTWLMVISTALLAWWQWDAETSTGDPMFAVWMLVAITALAFLGEILEFFAGVLGSQKAGGTRWGSIGALIGGLVGGIGATFLIPIPVIGSLMGACGGAALGALGLELARGGGITASTKSGVGAGVGRFVGTIAKLAVGGVIWLVVAVAAFWP